MKNPFTAHRWNTSAWQMYLLLGIAWASIWQIHDNMAPPRFGISIANLAGALVALIGMHLSDVDTARSVERWGYVMLIWSMSCYLALALRFEGFWGLVHQPNLGIVLTEAVVLAAVHRFIYGLVAKRERKRKAEATIELHEEAKAIVKHYTEGE